LIANLSISIEKDTAAVVVEKSESNTPQPSYVHPMDPPNAELSILNSKLKSQEIKLSSQEDVIEHLTREKEDKARNFEEKKKQLTTRFESKKAQFVMEIEKRDSQIQQLTAQLKESNATIELCRVMGEIKDKELNRLQEKIELLEGQSSIHPSDEHGTTQQSRNSVSNTSSVVLSSIPTYDIILQFKERIDEVRLQNENKDKEITKLKEKLNRFKYLNGKDSSTKAEELPKENPVPYDQYAELLDKYDMILRAYFFTVGAKIKEVTQNNKINLNSLYSKAVEENIPFHEVQRWLETKFANHNDELNW